MTPEPRPRCRGMRGWRGGPGWLSSGLPKNRRKKSSLGIWNWAGPAVARPSVRIVTTAGATTLTMSAYESRPPAIARVIWGVACTDAGAVDEVSADMRQAAPVSSTAAVPTATPVRVAHWLRLKRKLLIDIVPFENARFIHSA